MSIFDLHKDGVPPVSDNEHEISMQDWQQQFAQAMTANNLHEAYRLYKQLPNELSQRHINADDVYPLAQYAANERKSEDALAIVEGFSKRYPQHPDVVKNYLIAANVMHTQFGEHEQAQRLLTQLAQLYADHPDAELITQAQQRLH